MGVIIDDNMFEIITKPKSNLFDLPKDLNNNLKHIIDFRKRD